MAKNKNKVKFGLKNVHWAKKIHGEDGAVSYAKPKPIPGAVNLTLDRQGDEVEFEADDALYYVSYSDTGYKGTLEVALVPDDFRQEILNEVEDETDHVMVEYANRETSEFALLYEVSGDQHATRRVLYDCTVSKPGEDASTTGKTKTPKTESMSLSAVPLADGKVRARTKNDTVDTVYNGWFDSVWEPKPTQGDDQGEAQEV